MTKRTFALSFEAADVVSYLEPTYKSVVLEYKKDDEQCGEPQDELGRAGYPSLGQLLLSPPLLELVIGDYLFRDLFGPQTWDGRDPNYWFDRVRAAAITASAIGQFIASPYASLPCRTHFAWLRQHRASRLTGQATMARAMARSACVGLYKRVVWSAVTHPWPTLPNNSFKPTAASQRRLNSGVRPHTHMTDKKHKARVALRQASEALIVDVLSGKWSHVPGLSSKPIDQWVEVVASLERQCPGHAHQEYVNALVRANRDNR